MIRFTSRKFLLTLGACLAAMGSALLGEISYLDAVHAIVAAVWGYLAVEGVADAITRWRDQ